MPSPDDYEQEIFALGLGDLTLSANGTAEAKQQVARCRRLQRELRRIKKSVNLEIKTIRVRSEHRISNAGELASGVFSLFKQAGLGVRVKGDAKRGARHDRDAAIAPYKELILGIDDLLVQLDAAKDHFQSAIEADRVGTPPSIPAQTSGVHCTSCGQKVSSSDAYCRNCGARQPKI